MSYIGNRTTDAATSGPSGTDASKCRLRDQLQGKNEFSIGLCLLIGHGYGIPELFGCQTTLVHNGIDRLRPVVGPQNGIAPSFSKLTM